VNPCPHESPTVALHLHRLCCSPPLPDVLPARSTQFQRLGIVQGAGICMLAYTLGPIQLVPPHCMQPRNAVEAEGPGRGEGVAHVGERDARMRTMRTKISAPSCRARAALLTSRHLLHICACVCVNKKNVSMQKRQYIYICTFMYIYKYVHIFKYICVDINIYIHIY